MQVNHEINRRDRRVNRTRRQLRNALMSLILERGYNAVTVEDITERADLGRTTFYLHYRDKEELLIESLESIVEELKAQIDQLVDLEAENGQFRNNPVAVAFRHVEENRDLYRIILKGEGSSKVAGRVREIIEAAALDIFTTRMGQYISGPPELPTHLVIGYFASALMGFVTLWLEEELPYTGDEAADIFMVLFFRGATKVLNLNLEI